MKLTKLRNFIKDVDSRLLDFIGTQIWFQVSSWSWSSEGDTPVPGDSVVTEDLTDADVVSSLVNDGMRLFPPRRVPVHRPVLDIDFPVYVVESSTPGHYHLFLDKEMTWEQYSRLLNVMAEVGILEPGFVNASFVRKASRVRLPWVKK